MHVATATLESLSPYSQSSFLTSPKKDGENADDHEKRCWKERCHTDERGMLFIPPMAFKHAITAAAQYKSLKIPGKGNATYTKHFEAGIIVAEPLPLPINIKDVEGEWLWLNADGKRGGGTRVRRCMPKIPTWKGQVTFHILDDTITEEVFTNFLRESGNFIGIGRWRPRNGGMYGRFKVLDVQWKES